MQYITLDEIKDHLRIDSGHTDDDRYIEQLIDVAEESVFNYLNAGVTSNTGSTVTIDDEQTEIPKSLKQAIILLTAHWYLNRNLVSFAQGTEIPYAFKFLLNPYRIMAIQ